MYNVKYFPPITRDILSVERSSAGIGIGFFKWRRIKALPVAGLSPWGIPPFYSSICLNSIVDGTDG